jgi:hypothetical protein
MADHFLEKGGTQQRAGRTNRASRGFENARRLCAAAVTNVNPEIFRTDFSIP